MAGGATHAATGFRLFLEGVRHGRDLNPLSGLPGNRLIQQVIEDRVVGGTDALLYLDLNQFKAVNDVYGFTQGDRVLLYLAGICRDVTNEMDDGAGPPLAPASKRRAGFAGHVGGDDFVVIVPAARAREIGERLGARFDAGREQFYSAADLARGGVLAEDREGRIQRFDLVSLATVSVTRSGPSDTAVALSERAGELKHRAKQMAKETGRSVYLDDAPAPEGTRNLRDVLADPAARMDERKAAAEAMTPTTENLGTLVRLLDDGSGGASVPWDVLKSVIAALGRLGARDAAPRLAPLARHPNPHLRTRVIEALATLGAESSREAGLRGLDDPNIWVRRMAARVAWQWAAPEDLPALRERLANAADPQFAANLAVSLAHLGTAEVLPRLLGLLKSTGETRMRAAWALVPHCRSVARRDLETLLGDPDPRVREAAAQALGQRGERASLTQLRRLSHADTHPAVQEAALRAVRAILMISA